MLFISNTGHYVHPSVKKLKNGRYTKASQGVKIRRVLVWIKVSQWMFPDTSHFHGSNICTCSEEKFNKAMEVYAQIVLTLFLPHRCLNDLNIAGAFSYIRKL